MQQEGRTLQRAQALERQHEGDAHVLRVFGDHVGPRVKVHRFVDERLRQPHADVLLAPRLRAGQPVQAQPRGGLRQEGTRALHLRVVDLAPAQPAVLHHVLGLGTRAEHAVGERAQVAAVGFEVVAHTVKTTQPRPM